MAFSITAFVLTGCTTSPSEIPDEIPHEGAMGAEVVETINNDGSHTFVVMVSGEEVARIEKEEPVDGYEAYIFEETYIFEEIRDKLYVAINPTGLGGYILYGGAFELYEVDVNTKEVMVIFDPEVAAFATDISPDGEWLVQFIRNEVGENIVSLHAIDEYKSQNGFVDVTYLVPAEFTQVGDGQFSPDGSKLAYAASIGNPGEEETTIFVIDLDTGKQTEYQTVTGTVDVEWQSLDRPFEYHTPIDFTQIILD